MQARKGQLATPAPPIAARTTLLTLPTEPKAYIVKLARAQDDAYHELARRETAKASGRRKGRSANALFLVNRELSELAVVVLFKVLKASRCMTPALRFHVYDRRASFITHVAIDSSSHANIDSALCIIPSLPNFRRLSISGQAINDSHSESKGFAAVKDATKGLKSPPTCLALSHLDAEAAAALVPILPNLHRFELRYLTHDKAVNTLFRALGDLPALEHLGLDLRRFVTTLDDSSRVPQLDFGPLWKYSERLVTLDLYLQVVDDDTLASTRHWQHLKTLRTNAIRLSVAAQASDTLPPAFILPPLQHLELTEIIGNRDFLRPFLARLAPTQSLQSLTLDMHVNRSKSAALLLCDTLSRRLRNGDDAALREVNVSFRDTFDVDAAVARLRAVCEERGIVLTRF